METAVVAPCRGWRLALVMMALRCSLTSGAFEQVKREREAIAQQWAPLVWLHPEERYFPTTVESFLRNVVPSLSVNAASAAKAKIPPYPMQILPEGLVSQDYYLVAPINLECANCPLPKFLLGTKPNDQSAPTIYAIVHTCGASNLQFKDDGHQGVSDNLIENEFIIQMTSLDNAMQTSDKVTDNMTNSIGGGDMVNVVSVNTTDSMGGGDLLVFKVPVTNASVVVGTQPLVTQFIPPVESQSPIATSHNVVNVVTESPFMGSAKPAVVKRDTMLHANTNTGEVHPGVANAVNSTYANTTKKHEVQEEPDSDILESSTNKTVLSQMSSSTADEKTVDNKLRTDSAPQYQNDDENDDAEDNDGDDYDDFFSASYDESISHILPNKLTDAGRSIDGSRVPQGQLLVSLLKGDANQNKKHNVKPHPSSHNKVEQKFTVTYWLFFPYNYGKDVCTYNLGFLGRVLKPRVNGICYGEEVTMGNHVGDWEHVSINFQNGYPQKMYVSSHNFGAFYTYVPEQHVFKFLTSDTRKGVPMSPNFPETVQMIGNNPVLYSALGSHGLWSAPGMQNSPNLSSAGMHTYNSMPLLQDKTAAGIPWKTWKNLEVLETSDSVPTNYPPTKQWLRYEGHWGNPSKRCHMLMGGFCELSKGPTGVPRKRVNFPCSDLDHRYYIPES